MPTGEKETTLWRFTTTKPQGDWMKPGYDDSSWTEAPGGFGAQGRGAVVHTEWKTPDIWLRRTVTLPATLPANPMLRMHHDEDVEVYINGVLAAKGSGFTIDYEPVDLTAKGRAALKSGSNIIAVHCHQTTGGQFIDVGIVDEQPR